jgi:hypothetical protein
MALKSLMCCPSTELDLLVSIAERVAMYVTQVKFVATKRQIVMRSPS